MKKDLDLVGTVHQIEGTNDYFFTIRVGKFASQQEAFHTLDHTIKLLCTKHSLTHPTPTSIN